MSAMGMSAIGRAVVLSLLGGALAAVGRADGEFPYPAFIAVEGAEVVSGPGHRYYATERLPRGAEIEVYAEEASGWLAIRPPEGSFSWIPGEFVERSDEDEDVGRVIEPTPAWVGTLAEKVSEHRELVTLKSGELVKILGEKQVAIEDSEPQVWLKIAPPAGEFRWVHLRDVSRQKPEEEVKIIPAKVEPEPDLSSPAALPLEVEEGETEAEEPRRFRPAASAISLRDIEPVGPPSKSQPPMSRNREPVELAQYRGTEATASVRPLSPDGFVPRKRKGSEQLPTVPAPSQLLTRTGPPAFSRPKLGAPTLIADARPPGSRIGTSPVSTSASASLASSAGVDRLADQIEQLDLELSLMVAQDRSTWNLAGLAQRVNQLVEEGSDPVARGRARLLLDKIREFEEAFDVADFGPIGNASSTEPPPSAEPPAADPSPARGEGSKSADPRYDGQGWLQPVQSRSGKKSPPFALVDVESQPIMFVTPAPGMNLSRYLGKEVGVYGRRGYMESLKASHVTVEKVIDLERVVR